MTAFLDSGAVRAGTFFALAFAVATVGGVLLGDLRLGLRTGVVLGLAFAAFAYLFVRPNDEVGVAEATDVAEATEADAVTDVDEGDDADDAMGEGDARDTTGATNYDDTKDAT